MVNETLPIYLRTHGAGLVDVSMVSAATFPWAFKFLWSPLVDRLGTRRQWIAACMAGLTALMLVLALVDLTHLANWFWPLLILMVALSATQDIAIDAYTIEITTHRELGVANSVRSASYRVAMFVIAGGLLIWLAGRSDSPTAFQAGAVVLAVLTLATLLLPTGERAAARHESIWTPLKALARRGVTSGR